MKASVKLFGLGLCLVAMMCADLVPEASLKFRFIPEAAAIIGVAPGGSVVRRHAIMRTAAVASSSANANAAATANANAAAADANAAAAQANAAAAAAQTPPPAAPAAGPPAVGTIVTTLPPGCSTDTLNNVEYQRCGSTYYRATMQGSYLVYVVSQP